MPTIAIGVKPSPTGDATATVPVNSLSEDGVPPEEGDKIQCSVEGTVQSISGPNATISIDSINGEPVGEGAGSESPEEEAGEEEGQGAGGSPPTPAASGPNDTSRATMPMAKPLAAPPAGSPGMTPPLRTRMPRAATAALGQNLLRGARGRQLPF